MEFGDREGGSEHYALGSVADEMTTSGGLLTTVQGREDSKLLKEGSQPRG